MKTLDNLKLHPIGLGAMPLSLNGRPSQKEAIEIIETFLSLGGNFIDTADVYATTAAEKGHNEKLIQQAIQSINTQNDIVIATKGGASRPNDGWAFQDGHPTKLRKACEQSLKNLNISCHSLYYLHGPDPDVALEDSIGELVKLKEEGKIKNIGIANVALDQLITAAKLTTITAVQNRCNPFCKGDFKNGVIEFCKANQILYVPYCPLGGWYDHQRLASSQLYQPLTEKYGISCYQIALAWLLNKGNNILPIPGMDKTQFIESNFASIDLQLDKEDIDIIDHFPDLYTPAHVGVLQP